MPGAATMRDFQWLGWGERDIPLFNRIDPELVHENLAEGRLHLLRLLAPADGVILIQKLSNGEHSRLQVIKVAGVGIALIARSLAKVLLEVAAEWGCSSVETSVVDDRLAHAIMRAGAKVESFVMVLEVDDGR